MNNSDTNPLADSLVHVAALPLSWSVREEGNPENNYTRITEHNEHILRCVNLLGEQHRERVEEETESDSALMRLEAKMDMLLEMVSKLDQRISLIPQAGLVRLSSRGIEWRCNDVPPAVGSSVWIDLYIDNRIPEAMQIPATVLTVDGKSGGYTVSARFEALGELVQEQMEKLIFRHHRRMIAQSRSE